MEPHTDKQLQTAFEFVLKVDKNRSLEEIKMYWQVDKDNDYELYPSTIAVRALLLMMGVDPKIHRDDVFWINVYKSDNYDIYSSFPFMTKELADSSAKSNNDTRIAVKRIKVGDTE